MLRMKTSLHLIPVSIPDHFPLLKHQVCVKGHDGPTREEDAVRPDNPRLAKNLNAKDTYGNHKLAAEEVLAQVLENRVMPSPYSKHIITE